LLFVRARATPTVSPYTNEEGSYGKTTESQFLFAFFNAGPLSWRVHSRDVNPG
jgi:hypothetical protein